MEIPTEIKLFGVEYPVRLYDDVLNKAYGYMDWTNVRILINKNYDSNVKLLALWHEIIHLINGNIGYQDLRTNESFTEAFSNLLLSVLLELEESEWAMPKMVMIGAIPYKIEHIELKNVYGEIDYYKGTISLNKDLGSIVKYFTLIHEIVHLCLSYTGMHDLSADEIYVDRFTTFFI